MLHKQKLFESMPSRGVREVQQGFHGAAIVIEKGAWWHTQRSRLESEIGTPSHLGGCSDATTILQEDAQNVV